MKKTDFAKKKKLMKNQLNLKKKTVTNFLQVFSPTSNLSLVPPNLPWTDSNLQSILISLKMCEISNFAKC